MGQSNVDRRLYSSAERRARKSQLGLWNDKKPTPPWEWRRNNKLEAISKAFKESGLKEKVFAKRLKISPDELKDILNEDIKNSFKASGLEAEEFAVKSNIPPDKLKKILEGEDN